MIYVFSTEHIDISTDEVNEWLFFLNAKFKRINGEELRRNELSLLNEVLSFDRLVENFTGDSDKDENVIWFRRWDSYKDLRILEKERLGRDVYRFLINEASEYYSYFFTVLSHKENITWIDNINSLFLNKITTLQKAKKNGLIVPDTYIIHTKVQLDKLFKKHERLITKTIRNVTSFISENRFYGLSTKEIKYPLCNEIPERFYPSLVQKLIEKKYEIRTFYFFQKMYSMAMFSQRRKESQIDYRYYSTSLASKDRWVRYELPDDIKSNIIKLMGDLKLNSGSIDLIYTKNKQYLFLEVNPIGQLGMVSRSCMYGLEKIIASKLIELNKKDNNEDQ